MSATFSASEGNVAFLGGSEQTSSAFEGIMSKHNWRAGSGQAALNMGADSLKGARRLLSSLAVWILPIIVAAVMAAGVAGHARFRGLGKPVTDHATVTVQGEQPFRFDVVYYSEEFITVVKSAQREGREILTCFEALESAWNEVSPDQPLAIKLVTSPLFETGHEKTSSSDPETNTDDRASQLRGPAPDS